MDEITIPLSKFQLTCSLCSEIFLAPVSLHCGHNFCFTCIENHWHCTGEYCCYECKKDFGTRPSLSPNGLLTDIVEKFQKRAFGSVRPERRAERNDLSCDLRIERNQKAAAALNTSDLKSRIQQIKEDRQEKSTGDRCHHVFSKLQRIVGSFAFECTEFEYQSHDKVLVEKALREIKQTLQEKLKILAQMKKTLEHLKISEKTDLEDYQKTFTSLLQSIERLRNQVLKLITNHKQKEVTIKEVSIEQLEEEINDLNNRETELNELLKTEGHTFFHQKFPTSCFPTGDEHASDSEMKKTFIQLKHYHESMSGGVLTTKQSGRELATAERKMVEVSSEFHSKSSSSSVLKQTIISPSDCGKKGHGKSTGNVRDKIDECSKHEWTTFGVESYITTY